MEKTYIDLMLTQGVNFFQNVIESGKVKLWIFAGKFFNILIIRKKGLATKISVSFKSCQGVLGQIVFSALRLTIVVALSVQFIMICFFPFLSKMTKFSS